MDYIDEGESMAIKKEKIRNNYTKVSNSVLRDKMLSVKDRGVYCTICSLSDNWKFSLSGLCAIVPDGVDAVRTSLSNLQKAGYIDWKKTRGKDGRYISRLEVFSDRKMLTDEKISAKPPYGKTDKDKQSRDNHVGKAVMDNPAVYNTDNIRQDINTDNNRSINQSEGELETDGEIEEYRELIADNINLDSLLAIAVQHNNDEVQMVREIYDVICDMVCYPRNHVMIKGVAYPWKTVQAQFLKLQYYHIRDILNRIVETERVKNMSAYLVSTLYTQSLAGKMEEQVNISDDLLTYMRGIPY